MSTPTKGLPEIFLFANKLKSVQSFAYANDPSAVTTKN